LLDAFFGVDVLIEQAGVTRRIRFGLERDRLSNSDSAVRCSPARALSAASSRAAPALRAPRLRLRATRAVRSAPARPSGPQRGHVLLRSFVARALLVRDALLLAPSLPLLFRRLAPLPFLALLRWRSGVRRPHAAARRAERRRVDHRRSIGTTAVATGARGFSYHGGRPHGRQHRNVQRQRPDD
jgi:hypothetical protein